MFLHLFALGSGKSKAEESANALIEGRAAKELLVQMYRERRFLWDPKDPRYKVLSSKQHAWNEMANALNLTIREVKENLQNMRSQFLREHKKVKKRVTGQAAADVYVSSWWLYNELLFLADVLETRRCTSSVSSICL